MAFTFDQVDITGLRATHFEQLLSYLENREREDWYYGNKKQFDQRHDDLRKWLEGIQEVATSEGAKIPKE